MENHRPYALFIRRRVFQTSTRRGWRSRRISILYCMWWRKEPAVRGLLDVDEEELRLQMNWNVLPFEWFHYYNSGCSLLTDRGRGGIEWSLLIMTRKEGPVIYITLSGGWLLLSEEEARQNNWEMKWSMGGSKSAPLYAGGRTMCDVGGFVCFTRE